MKTQKRRKIWSSKFVSTHHPITHNMIVGFKTVWEISAYHH